MSDDFLKIAEEHVRKYPSMEPQDFGKLAYQSEFGPKHLIADKQRAKDYLMEEWEKLPQDSTPQLPESIGGGLCRFPLSACHSADEVLLLADLFVLTAGQHHGSMEGLAEKLEQIERMNVSGMKEWIKEWKREQCPSLHHSKAYNAAYQPHYRLVRKEYADYFAVLVKIYRLMEKKTSVIIAIDGRCGSGKSHLAGLIENLFSCNVIHMDDFYLPLGQRQENWMDIPGGNMDIERFFKELLHPIREGRQAVYHPYNCQKNEMGKAVPLENCPLTVVEGSYSQHPMLKAEYDLRIFLTCDKEEQKRRLQNREGSYFPVFEKQWIPLEENYLRHCPVERDSHFIVDTSCFF